jgi:hypothetical protein
MKSINEIFKTIAKHSMTDVADLKSGECSSDLRHAIRFYLVRHTTLRPSEVARSMGVETGTVRHSIDSWISICATNAKRKNTHNAITLELSDTIEIKIHTDVGEDFKHFLSIDQLNRWMKKNHKIEIIIK